MLSKIIINAVIFLLVTILFSGCFCVSSTAPNYWLDNAEKSLTTAYGAWVQIYLEKKRLYKNGELICVSENKVYLLSADSLLVFDKEEIYEARLFKYDSQYKKLSTWSFSGGLLSFSHGYIGAITLPAWVIVGSIATSAQSRDPLLIYPKQKLESFKPHARFPNELPKGIDIFKVIKGKPGFD